MSLPDRLEQLGIVVGSVVMVPLPLFPVVVALTSASPPWWAALAPLAVGLVVGVLVATDRVGFDYQSVWFVSLVGYFLSILGLFALDVSLYGGSALTVAVIVAVSLAVAAGLDSARQARAA